MNRLFTALILVAAQFVATSASQASAVAGEVLFVAGPNSVEREGPTIGLLKGSFIFEGDTINTGAKGRIQLLMVDGARIAIRPNTTFSVQTYQLPGRTKDPIAIASNDGKAVLRLAKGAFRAMSGRIGKSYNKANYQVIAPVATMGIRGTDYTVRFCSADCGKGKAQGAAPKNGLYIGVNSGGVWARNAEGEINVNKNQFAFIGAADAKPEFLLQPPALLRARATEDEGEAEEEDKDSSEGKDADAEADTDADDDDGSDEDADGDSSVEDSRENLDPPAAESGEDTGDTGTTPDDSSDTDKPEQTITAQNDEGDELSLEDGEILDDIKDIVDLPEPDDQDGNNGGGDDNKPDDGNPNDGKDNDPDDGNAGGGNDDDKDSNPDDGNNGGGNDDKPDDGNNGGGNDDDKDNNPDDGNNGGGNDDKPDDGNNGGGNDKDKDNNPDDGNNGGGNDDKPDDGNNGGGNDKDKDNNPDDGNNGGGNDNKPDDGNNGGGNDKDKDNNPDDGNNGGGNDNKPDDGNNGGGNDKDKDNNPDDGNNGGGNDDKPDDGNNGGGNDDKPDDGNNGGGNDDKPDDGNNGGGNDKDKDNNPDDGNNGGGNDDKPDDGKGNGGSNDDDDDDEDDDNNGNGKAKGKSAESKAGLARSTNSTNSLAIVSSNGSVSSISQASLANATADGEDTSTGLKWGRWDDGFESQQVTHWVADSSPDRAVVLPTEGTLDYTLSGGTAPTDNQGNVGTLDSGSLTADFTNQTVTNTLVITIGGDTWTATDGTGDISSGAPVFSGTYENVDISSGNSGKGEFSGFFGGAPLTSGAPSGAGLGYTLNSNDLIVNGAAAFKATD